MDKKEISWSDYVSSPYWKSFSKKALNDPNVYCQICGRPKWAIYKVNRGKHKAGDKRRLIVLNLHHTDYLNLGVDQDHVIPICRRCHLLAHDLEKAARNDDGWQIVYQALLDNTNWAYEEADTLYVPSNFKLKQTRKKK